VINFERSGGWHLPSRFVVATIVAPIGLIAMSLPANRILGQYVAGRAVVDGGIELSGTMFLIELLGWVLTGSAIFLAANRSDPALRPLAAPLPLGAAAGTLGSVLAAGGLAPTTPALNTLGLGLGGMALGGLIGVVAARLILDPADLVVPVDAERSTVWSLAQQSVFSERPGVARIGGDLSRIGEWQPPTWTGRTSHPGLLYWIFPAAFAALQLLMVDTRRSPFVVASIAITVAAWGIGIWIRRLRVAIGPSGLVVSSAILATPMIWLELERIESAAATAQVGNRLGGWWRDDGSRLTISPGLRAGAALLVTLADGSELLFATLQAPEAAAELSRLLP